MFSENQPYKQYFLLHSLRSPSQGRMKPCVIQWKFLDWLKFTIDKPLTLNAWNQHRKTKFWTQNMPNFCRNWNCCTSSTNKDETCASDGTEKNGHLDKKKRKVSRRPTQKILLLGTGESGKSTFLKQMRIITGKSFTETELQNFKDIIYDNIYKGVLYLLQVSLANCIIFRVTEPQFNNLWRCNFYPNSMVTRD